MEYLACFKICQSAGFVWLAERSPGNIMYTVVAAMYPPPPPPLYTTTLYHNQHHHHPPFVSVGDIDMDVGYMGIYDTWREFTPFFIAYRFHSIFTYFSQVCWQGFQTCENTMPARPEMSRVLMAPLRSTNFPQPRCTPHTTARNP